MGKNQKLCWKNKTNCRQIYAVMYKHIDRKVHLRVKINSEQKGDRRMRRVKKSFDNNYIFYYFKMFYLKKIWQILIFVKFW